MFRTSHKGQRERERNKNQLPTTRTTTTISATAASTKVWHSVNGFFSHRAMMTQNVLMFHSHNMHSCARTRACKVVDNFNVNV